MISSKSKIDCIFTKIIKVDSINSFRGIFEFVSSRLLCGKREQCEHCDRLTNSKIPKEIKNHRKVHQPTFLY